MPGYVESYIKEQEHDKAAEREWHERQTERIPSWMDEERITARRYEEGPHERDYHFTNNDYSERESDLPDWEEKEHTIRMRPW